MGEYVTELLADDCLDVWPAVVALALDVVPDAGAPGVG